jgi:hypothetical protein
VSRIAPARSTLAADWHASTCTFCTHDGASGQAVWGLKFCESLVPLHRLAIGLATEHAPVPVGQKQADMSWATALQSATYGSPYDALWHCPTRLASTR